MFTSILLAWLAVLFTVLSAVLYLIKRSGNQRLRRLFSRIHRSVGVLLIVAGILHGILAGNVSDATINDMMLAPLLFTWNWGTASLIAAILLAVSYMLRRRLRKQWMMLHRVLTVALIALIVLHVSDVGIQLFDTTPTVAYAQTEAVATAAPAEAETGPVITILSADGGTGTAAAAVSADNETGTETTALIESANSLFSGAALIDGVYEGSASGYKGMITVSVTVSGGQVTAIDVVSDSDTPSYFNRAESVIDTVIDEQSLEVDAVSGATYSSAGIINAVSDALSAAVDSGTLAVTEFTYTDKHGSRGH